MNTQVTKEPRVGKNYSMVLEEVKSEDVSLPPAEGFNLAFKKWQDELIGAEESKRATSKPGELMEMYACPSIKSKKVMKAYHITGRTWPQSAPPANRSLLSSALYQGKEEPMIRMSASKSKALETSMRECMSILSHLDWFLAASKTELRKQTEALTCKEGMDMEKLSIELKDFGPGERNGVVAWAQQTKDDMDREDQDIWNSLHNVVGLIESAGRCTQDAAVALIDSLGCSTLARRDSWLEKFPKLLPKETLLSLRGANINEEKLFNEEDVKSAIQVLESRKASQVQDHFLARPTKTQEKKNYEGDGRKFQRNFRTGGPPKTNGTTSGKSRQKRRFVRE